MQTIRRVSHALCAAIVLALVSASPAAAKDYLYLSNTFAESVSIISIPEHEIVRTHDVGGLPDDVHVSPDGKTMYVNLVGSVFDVSAKDEVNAYDTETGERLWSVEPAGLPNHMKLTKDGHYLFVPTFNGWLHIVDTKKKAIQNTIRTGLGGHGLELSPDEKTVYIGLIIEDALVAVDWKKKVVRKKYQMDDSVRPFMISPDERYAYVQLSRLNGFHVVDLEKGAIVQTVHLPDVEEEIMKEFPYTILHGMSMSPDGKRLFVAHTTDDYLAVYERKTLELVKTIPLGEEPAWVTVSPDGRFVYTSNRGDDTLSVVDTGKLEEVKRLETEKYPQRMSTIRVP